jgi:hypothetical protein
LLEDPLSWFAGVANNFIARFALGTEDAEERLIG